MYIMALNTLSLYNMFSGSGGFVQPSRHTNIEDNFGTIASMGNKINDANISTYLVQDLAPNKEYKLIFQMFKETAAAGGGTVWTNVLGTNASLNPASVLGLADNVITRPVAGGFWWSSLDATRQLLFKTPLDMSSTISGTNFGGVRQGATFNTPPAEAGYQNFVGTKSLTLLPTGKPNALPAITHSYDGYLFIFSKLSFAESNNKHYTTRFVSNDFVGHSATDNTKGFLRIADIHAAAVSTISANFSTTMFETVGGKFYEDGTGLSRTSEYVAALMLVNKDCDYIVSEIDPTDSTLNIRWFLATIPVGGVWSITLGSFQRASAIYGSLSDATSAVVNVDSIGIQGSILDSANFKILITAEPVVI